MTGALVMLISDETNIAAKTSIEAMPKLKLRGWT